ncbi:MAG: hypothetical protein ABR501_07645 [Pyrinomonadaceae bacterium]
MPGWAKALIIVAVIVVLLVVGAIAAGAFWWSRNKDTLIARGKAVVTEGKEAGRNSDNQGCVDQSIARYKKAPGFTSVIETSIFMQTCLQHSRPTPGFCDDVPKETEFSRTVEWRTTQCRQADLASDNYCQQLFKPVQQFCQRGSGRSQEDSVPTGQ